MLTDAYKSALQALKDQAQAATMQIVNENRHAKKEALADAQRRLAQYPTEAKRIVRVLLTTTDPSLTIMTLDVPRLAQELDRLSV